MGQIGAGNKSAVPEYALPLIGMPAYWHSSDDLLGGQASAVPQSYIRALVKSGAGSLILPVSDDRQALWAAFRRIDGLLLIGGPDVAPHHYRQTPLPGLRRVTPERDGMELMLVPWALAAGMPVLCICRGLQLLNVALGGTLWQDLATQVPQALKHDYHPGYKESYLAHRVRLESGGLLDAVCGSRDLMVNSLHHQAIDRLGDGLRVAAWAPDGIVEAVIIDELTWGVGVQWHPEWLVDEDGAMLALFRAFRDACRDWRRRGEVLPYSG